MINKKIILEIKKYNSKSEFSYTIGIFPTIKLLETFPKNILGIVLTSKAKKSKGIKKINLLAKKNNIVLEFNDKYFDILKLKENSYCIGIFKKFNSEIFNDNHIVLVSPENFGNLGTIILTACGFNILNIGIIRPGANIFNPETIRASMGSVFDINFEYFYSLEEYQNKFIKNNLYLFYTDGKENLININFKKPYSLIFGSESSGLDEKHKSLGTTVKIEQSKLIDSLNLAISTGIVMYEAQYDK